MIGYAKVAGAVGLVVFLLVAAWAIDRHGYTRGADAKTAYYEPILRKAAQDKIEADRRADAADQRAAKINTDLEIEHAASQQALLARAAAAESRIADLLRQRAADPPHGGVKVPAVPGPTTGGTGQSPGRDRDDRLAASVSTVGAACEHDADALARWQEWYSRQRSSLNQPTGETP